MKKFFKLIICIILIFVSSGCEKISKTNISYTVYPIGFALNRIIQNKIDVVSIQNNKIVQNSSIDDNYKQILDKSLYLFHIGDLEPYFKVYKNEIKETKVKVIDMSNLAIYNFKRYTLFYVDGSSNFVESNYYSSDLFDNLDIPEKELFLWLDPISMISIAKDMTDILASNYAEESSFFNDNYKKFEEELINLDAEYQKLSNSLKKNNKVIKFVSLTNSFGVWQKTYGFQVYPVSLSKYGILPNEKQLEVIKKKIAEDNVKYIAYEPNMTEEMKVVFEKLETELNLTRINLSNLSSLTETQINDNKDYFSIMYENLTVLENIATDSIPLKENTATKTTTETTTTQDSEVSASE